MVMPAVSLSLFLLFPAAARGHAVLSSPLPRDGMGVQDVLDGGDKPLTLAGRTTFLDDCGTLATTSNPGRGTPRQSFKAGSTLTVSWNTAVAHDGGPIRFAIDYGGDDASLDFSENVLSTLESPGEGPHSAELTLPADKECPDGCVLQFQWLATGVGGYVGCADIAVTEADTGLSGGSLFLILGFVGAVCYLGGGFAFKRYNEQQQANNSDDGQWHPHQHIWSNFFVLVSEGASYSKQYSASKLSELSAWASEQKQPQQGQDGKLEDGELSVRVANNNDAILPPPPPPPAKWAQPDDEPALNPFEDEPSAPGRLAEPSLPPPKPPPTGLSDSANGLPPPPPPRG